MKRAAGWRLVQTTRRGSMDLRLKERGVLFYGWLALTRSRFSLPLHLAIVARLEGRDRALLAAGRGRLLTQNCRAGRRGAFARAGMAARRLGRLRPPSAHRLERRDIQQLHDRRGCGRLVQRGQRHMGRVDAAAAVVEGTRTAAALVVALLHLRLAQRRDRLDRMGRG